MTNEVLPITEDDLLAYVDGALEPERRQAVEAYLEATPEAAARVQADLAATQALRAALGPTVLEPTPERLTTRLRSKPRRGGLDAAAQLAAAALLLAVGVGAGWTARDAFPSPGGVAVASMAQRAMTAHAVFAVEMRHPVEVSAREQGHLVAWLSKRLGRPVSAPDLSPLGFSLIGGRLLPDAEGPAAQFMYEDDSGRRITLYAARPVHQGLAAFRFERGKGLESFFWRDERLAYAVVGEIGRPELRRVALRAYEALS